MSYLGLSEYFVFLFNWTFGVTCNCYIGAPWTKLNNDKVCFGAKNDSYGRFNIKSNGIIMAFKLEYISGYVTCNNKKNPYGSHWNCKEESKIGTIVTNANDKVIFPNNYNNKVYTLPGYHDNSPELVFYGHFSPVIVTALHTACAREIWIDQSGFERREKF